MDFARGRARGRWAKSGRCRSLCRGQHTGAVALLKERPNGTATRTDICPISGRGTATPATGAPRRRETMPAGHGPWATPRKTGAPKSRAPGSGQDRARRDPLGGAGRISGSGMPVSSTRRMPRGNRRLALRGPPPTQWRPPIRTDSHERSIMHATPAATAKWPFRKGDRLRRHHRESGGLGDGRGASCPVQNRRMRSLISPRRRTCHATKKAGGDGRGATPMSRRGGCAAAARHGIVINTRAA
jgi:hypothetical protein